MTPVLGGRSAANPSAPQKNKPMRMSPTNERTASTALGPLTVNESEMNRRMSFGMIVEDALER